MGRVDWAGEVLKAADRVADGRVGGAHTPPLITSP
jgi:hypothetical protein